MQFDSICYSVRHVPKFVSLDSSKVFMFFLPSTSNSEDCHDRLSRVCFTFSHSPFLLMHIHKRSYVHHHLGRSPHNWYAVVALRRGGQIFRTAGFIHPLLKTTHNSLLIFGFKPISTVPARIAVEYTNTCGCQYWHIERILILLTDRPQRNTGVQYESRCTSEMCRIYLLALYNHRYLPVTSSACLPATYLRTYLRTYINTCPLTHLPTYRSIC